MQDSNPYSAPIAPDDESVVVDNTTPTIRLWTAFMFAPPVAPFVAAAAVFLIALAWQINNPDDDGTPIGVIAAPVGMLIIGIPISYGLAAMIGMPLAFFLRHRDSLNGWTVHATALVCAAPLAIGVVVFAALRMPPRFSSAIATFAALALTGVVMFLFLMPFTLLSGLTFWLVGVRSRKKPQSIAVINEETSRNA